MVIGAGLHGACTAMHLAESGLSTILIDKDTGGRQASSASAGGIRRLMRDPAELPLAMAATEMWQNIQALTGDHCGYRMVGQIKIAEDEDDLRRLEERAALTASLGYRFEEVIDARELRQRLPTLAPHCVGALLVRDDGFASPFRSTLAFQKMAVKAGAAFCQREAVLGIRRHEGKWRVTSDKNKYRVERIVNCAGAWGGRVASKLGESSAVTVKAPTMMITEPTAHAIHPVVGAASRKLSLKQLPNGALLVGGGYPGAVDVESERSVAVPANVAKSAKTVTDLFPHFAGVRVLRCWSGYEGHTPDGLPIIGESAKTEGVFHAYAFCGHGFQLAPVVGRELSSLIRTGQSDISLDAFSPARFH